jgi:hypothetical protein
MPGALQQRWREPWPAPSPTPALTGTPGTASATLPWGRQFTQYRQSDLPTSRGRQCFTMYWGQYACEAWRRGLPVVLQLGEVVKVSAGGAARTGGAAVSGHAPQEQQHRLKHVHLHAARMTWASSCAWRSEDFTMKTSCTLINAGPQQPAMPAEQGRQTDQRRGPIAASARYPNDSARPTRESGLHLLTFQNCTLLARSA